MALYAHDVNINLTKMTKLNIFKKLEDQIEQMKNYEFF